MAAQVRRVLFQVSLVAFLALALGVGQPASAALIAYDQFDYATGDLAGNNGGLGFNGAWYRTRSGTATVGSQLAFSNYPMSGNAALFTKQDNWADHGYMNGGRQFAINPTGTLWVSFLGQMSGQWGNGGAINIYSQFWTASHHDGQDEWGNLLGTQTMSITPETNDFWQGQFGYKRTALEGTPANLTDITATYLYIAKFENMGSSGNETLWVLNSGQYDAIKAGGITEAELNGGGAVTAKIALTGVASASLNNQYLRLGGHGDSAVGTLTVDEIKYGTTVDDVTGAVPEPATMALLGLGAVTLLAKRRRR